MFKPNKRDNRGDDAEEGRRLEILNARSDRLNVK